MSAQDRLTVIVAEHAVEYVNVSDEAICKCGKLIPESEHPAHVAAVIASADDLAVIELPEPDGDYWQAGPFEVTTSVGGEVIVDHEYWLSPSDATAGCAGILAAVKAAEAVSDRG
ncbi:hypothetical protein FK268_09270 [Tsukamurella sputi]|uniref:Uncharacterized protein n=1 Tax=Tsukamurella sputi TaxID=2591848 RepID=A0A5C5RRX8_9ACTN|nr:hypothetical protein [Tsukamurella sputi]TWS25370.1 hypothetical protein FK268_09270 [Tsukamurella sputi]